MLRLFTILFILIPNLLHAEDKKEKNRNKVIEVKPETQKGEITSTNEDLGITVNKLQSETQGITKSKPKTYIDTIGSTPILINGDFRYRLESEQAIIDDQENNDVLRSRIRLRLKYRFTLSEHFNFIGRFATGSGSATSTNQTLGDGFENEPNWFDLAYINFHGKNFILDAGKIPNIFERVVGSGLVWDGDTSPEGFQASYKNRIGILEAHSVAGYMVLRADENRENAYLGAIQASLTLFLKPFSVLLGGSYYAWKNIELEADDENDGDGFQYTEIPYTQPNGYMIINFKNLPISLFGDYVKNTAVEEKNQAWLVGFAFKGFYMLKNLKISYYWRYIEQNSVLNQYMDSDFNGGQTNAEGNSFFIKYKFTKYLELAFTHLNAYSLSDHDDHLITNFMDLKVKF